MVFSSKQQKIEDETSAKSSPKIPSTSPDPLDGLTLGDCKNDSYLRTVAEKLREQLNKETTKSD